MEDLKQAYELLGLEEGAAREDVEKRYFLLIRRARSSKQRVESDAEADLSSSAPNLEDVNHAYKLILAAEDQKTQEAFNETAYGKYKKMAGSAEKVDHFFSYYKFHLLGAIAVILILVFGIKAYVDHRHEQAELAKLPPADVTVSFFGDYISDQGSYPSSDDIEPMQNKLLAQFPEWKRVVVFMTYVPSEMKSQQDSALLQKSMLDLITNKPDIYILDKVNFMKLAMDGGLLPLDDKLQALDKNKLMKTATKDNPSEEHVYGYDITASPLFKDLPIHGKEYIAGVRFDTKKLDSALHLIEKYAAAK
ncbi:J domain-containing protein [Paenibacillus solisilvae]|uniref:J domain-containing protein n=1 Tax=Paenibacillus solisilvae TaxID=2486751 RepID=A0ABW0W8W2_9BACL